MKGMELTPAAQADRDHFEAGAARSGCSCFISPSCGFCTHPGNPRNQDEVESCWQPEVDEVPAEIVREETGTFIGVDIAADGRDCTVVMSRSKDGRIHIANGRDLLDSAAVLIKAFEDMRNRRAAVANASIPPENRP